MRKAPEMSDCPTLRIRPVLRVTLLAVCWCCSPLAAEADWQIDIGFLRLEAALGDQMLTGQGVFISQVEAGSGSLNKYYPDPNSSHFDATLDPFGVVPTFVNGSLVAHPNPTYSSHATLVVASAYYGDRIGVAKGANTIVMYEATDYLKTFLNCGLSGCSSAVPDAPIFTDPSDGQQKNYAIQNHSWVGSLGSDLADQRAIRKVDYLVDEYELTTVVGLNNGTTGDPHPDLDHLLAHSYNAIVVGVSDGDHAIGPTTLGGYGTGRTKPTLVAPLGVSSSATAVVSGAATIMHEELAGTDGTRSEPMRAILLAGATKNEFIDFVDPGTGLVDPWDRTTSRPLDNILGAGEINVFNSYLITQGGQFAGSTATPTPVDSYGWDYQTVNTTNDRLYEIEIPEGSTATELSVILTWNVDVNSIHFGNQTLADLSLTLRDSTNAIIELSDSSVDNTEHIYIGADQDVSFLEPGTYTLEVSADGFISQDYGLAWRTSTLFDEASADFDEDGDVDGSDFLTWQRGLGILLGASHGDGDADGDGDVDRADLAIFEADYGTSALVTSVLGVPEPGALVLVAMATLVLFSRRRN